MDKKLVIAHRGASRLARENTLEAFQKAIDIGADFIELDVRESRDKILVVYHNADIQGLEIKDLDFTEINKKAGKLGYHVPSLEEALKLTGGKIKVQIEIKTTGCETEIAQTALKFLNPENFYVISFSLGSLQKVKKVFPSIKTGLILGATRQTLSYYINQKQVFPYVDMFALNWKLWRWKLHWLIPKIFLVGIWTVDDTAVMKKILKDKRVWAITSNVPDLALKIRSTLKK